MNEPPISMREDYAHPVASYRSAEDRRPLEVQLYSDPENGSLLGGIETENVVAVVDPERTIESDRRYSLVELVTDASATSQSMSAPPPPPRSPLLSGRSQALRDISRAS